MQREACGGCGSTRLDPVLDLGSSPVSCNFPLEPYAALKRYPLGLLRCGSCTLTQISELVPDEELWSGEYGFYSGTSAIAVAKFRDYADEIMRDFGDVARRFTVEIACNDGVLLAPLREAGCKALGVDPARGPASKAIGMGLDVRVEPFSFDVARDILEEHGPAGLIIANNVLAHVVNLMDFVAGIYVLLAEDGVCVVEFQYLVDLVVGNQFDHVYHEHRQFFSLASLMHLLAEHDLMVVSVKQTDSQGGSLRVVIKHSGPGVVADHTVRSLVQAEEWLKDPRSLASMQGHADRVKKRLVDILWQQKLAKKYVAGYGASAKSVTLFNSCGIGPDLVPYMVDTTPTKHGRYIPGAGIPIVSPSADNRQPDVYLMTVWNWLSDVMRQEHRFTQGGGRWLVPIPTPVLL